MKRIYNEVYKRIWHAFGTHMDSMLDEVYRMSRENGHDMDSVSYPLDDIRFMEFNSELRQQEIRQT